MLPSINITEPAREYLKALLASEGAAAARLFVTDPGSERAETCLAYCHEGEEDSSDKELNEDGLHLYLEQKSLPFLKGLDIDLKGAGAERSEERRVGKEGRARGAGCGRKAREGKMSEQW